MIRVKIKVHHVPGLGVGTTSGLTEGVLGGEPGYPDLVLVKRPAGDILVTRDGWPMLVLERLEKKGSKAP